MKNSCCVLIIGSFILMHSSWLKAEEGAAHSVVQKITGTAINMKDKSFFYTEEDEIYVTDDHIIRIDSNYKDKDSKSIVEMHADFSKKPYFPDIHFSDHRREAGFKIDVVDKKVEISQNLKDPKETKTKKIEFDSDMTNSMGLINYIRENIAELKKNTKSFRYLVPALMDDYGMKLEFRENTDKEDTSVRFALKLKSFFIRNISGIKESLLSFDEKRRFIKSFRGVSNILDSDNKPVEVEINYSEPVETRTETKTK